MAFTTRELINSAYYLSGVRSRSLQSVSGADLEDGLDRLNDFLALMWSKTKLIPYFTVTDDVFVPGQEKYFIPNLLEIETFTFFLQSPAVTANAVRIPLTEQSRYEYFSTPRPEDVRSIPYAYHLERTLGGSNLFVYFLPQEAYNFQITGKYALLSTQLNQDLSTIYDDGYILYLRYGLAIYIAEWFSQIPPRHVIKAFNEIENHMTTLSPMDFTLRFPRGFSNNAGWPNWGDVNYGKGWR